jgi:hypothetical protein
MPTRAAFALLLSLQTLAVIPGVRGLVVGVGHVSGLDQRVGQPPERLRGAGDDDRADVGDRLSAEQTQRGGLADGAWMGSVAATWT